ncbi:transcriptional regulator [Azorhizobium oxalatiphilum]|uniref:Transcriptional regulator n=1 Tax=Azorhizobium oxalatiphilum TaxID=980631 RepID=A0A917C328_9HYPH|nr:Crp/Fnr family transcriptional regulator [Azorhizobium oxalatiphilum]GGF67627.1 transcriptional regulator [Azorhizobium oxalatiphilum]
MTEHPMKAIARRLDARNPLDDDDVAALNNVRCAITTHPPESFLFREADRPGDYCSILLSGLAFRQKVTAHGKRQIVAVLMAGDFIDAQHLFLDRADHNLEAATAITVAEFSRHQFRDVILNRPRVGVAAWKEALEEGAIFREWLVTVGARPGPVRVAHFLCELGCRLERAGLASREDFIVPLTQEQIADVLGLTPVHVNRVLKSLVADGLISQRGRSIQVSSWERLTVAGEFNPIYLGPSARHDAHRAQHLPTSTLLRPRGQM